MTHAIDPAVALAAGIFLAATLLSTPSPCRADGVDDAAIVAHSLVSAGDTARLEHVLAKARRGESVTVAVIGGSITQGAKATAPDRRYGDLIAKWWREQFPQTEIKFVNAGIGATGSNYGALRAQRDLLSHHPDFVVVEYAVNDGNAQAYAVTLEGLIRQILSQPNQPAVALLFMMNQNGGNAQEWHSKVGAHYGLPMISYRDALWPEIKDGHMKWEDVGADQVHPNDCGHAYAAEFVDSFVGGVLKHLPADNQLPAVKPLPQPLYSDLYQHVALFEAADLKPTVNQGWTYDDANPWAKGWKSDKPGSVIEFEIPGQVILMMEFHLHGPMGKVKVQVDDQPPTVVDSWFDQTWGGWRCTHEIGHDLKPGKHRVRIELLEDKNPQSDGHEFRLLGLGAAGVEGGAQ